MSHRTANVAAKPDKHNAARLLQSVGQRGRLGRATVSEVEAAWSALSDGAHPDLLGVALLHSPAVARVLRHARAHEQAEAMARSALTFDIGDDEVSARLRLELATVQIAQTRQPEDLPGDVRAVLRHADAHLVAGRVTRAALLVVLVNEAIFHRELHGEVERSPLAFEPEDFLAPLRESLNYRALVAPMGAMIGEIEPLPAERTRGLVQRVVHAVAPVDATLRRALGRALGSPGTASVRHRAPDPIAAESLEGHDGRRLLVISAGNLHFTRGILTMLESASDVKIRTVDLRSAGTAFPRRGHTDMAADRLSQAIGRALPALPAETTALLNWADTMFVDWCDVGAQWAAVHVPPGVRLIIRAHSLEALSPQPHMIDWSTVADLVFVAGHVRDMFLRVVPAARHARHIHVVPNEMRLERYGLPKRPSARHTIAMVGWGQMVKDPHWALEVLSRLRSVDPRWRLLLIGRDFAESQIVSGYRYRDAYRARAAGDDVREGIVDLGYITDLPEALREVGFILSSSRREGNPVGIAEGAASAAVPVVRDWPMAAPYGGASRVFPADWIVADPVEAAQRVLAFDDESWVRAGHAARDYVVANLDWSVVAPRYLEIFSDHR